jgi:hypothetical protein
VGRFAIVKAMGANNSLLSSVFNLIAIRAQDVFYKAKSNDFTQVLRTLKIVSVLNDSTSQVDRMWQQLIEIALFSQTKTHRKPVDILKSFITGSRDQQECFKSLTGSQQAGLRNVFKFLNTAYKSSELRTTSLATDQTRFYAMIAALIASDLLTTQTPEQLTAKLVTFGKILDDDKAPRPADKKEAVEKYLELSRDRTTDSPRRDDRQRLFLEVLNSL